MTGRGTREGIWLTWGPEVGELKEERKKRTDRRHMVELGKNKCIDDREIRLCGLTEAAEWMQVMKLLEELEVQKT